METLKFVVLRGRINMVKGYIKRMKRHTLVLFHLEFLLLGEEWSISSTSLLALLCSCVKQCS